MNIVFWSLLYLYLFWGLFIICMACKHAWDTLPTVTKVLVSPFALGGIVIDVLSNCTVAMPVFWEWKIQEKTVSTRCGRLKYSGTAYQQAVAKWICGNLLDPFEIGGHCR